MPRILNQCLKCTDKIVGTEGTNPYKHCEATCVELKNGRFYVCPALKLIE